MTSYAAHYTPPPDTTTTSAGREAVLQDGWPVLRPLAMLLPAITDARVKAVFEHWLAMRGRNIMPAWRDIDALQISQQLPYMWSLRYDRADNSFTGRLSGEEINAIFGKSLRQTRIENFFAKQDVPWIHERCLRVINKPCIALVTGPVYAYTGHYGSGYRIMLPLGENYGSEHQAQGDEVIGVTSYTLNPPGPDVASFQPVEQVTYFHL